MSTITRIGLAAGAVAATVALTQAARDRSPAGAGDRNGRPYRASTESVTVRAQQAIRVDTFYVQRVAGGSGLGNPGDLLITFAGQGFTLSAKAPRLELAADFALEATEINRDGTELYVLMPRTQMSRIAAMRFDSVLVANPGARREQGRSTGAPCAPCWTKKVIEAPSGSSSSSTTFRHVPPWKARDDRCRSDRAA